MQSSDEVEAAGLAVYAAMTSGDPEAVVKLLAEGDGVLGIGSDPAEWWEGREEVARATRVQVPEMQGIGFESTRASGWADGNVGWFADEPVLKLPDGSEQRARFTAVFTKTGTDWRMLQFHFSMGVGNEEAIGIDLPT